MATSKSKLAKFNRPAFSSGIFTSIVVICTSLTKIFDRIVSPWDELYHLAYVQYMYNFKIPQPGDVILSWSKYAFSCFPVHPFGMTTSIACGAEAPPEAFPEVGRNVASGWPPIYYGLASLWLRMFGANPDNALFLARSFSAFIWALGAGLFSYALVSRNKLPWETAVSISLVLALFPMGLFQGNFVTPHSSLLILVSLIYLSATSPTLISSRGLIRNAILATISILTIPHILPILVFLTIRIFWIYWTENRGKTKVFIAYISAMVMLPFSTILLWPRFQASRKLDAGTPDQPTTAFSIDTLTTDLFTFIPHSIDGYQFMNQWQFLISYILSIFFLVLLFRSLVEMVSPLLSKLDSVLMFFISAVFGVIEHIQLQIIIPPRYGLSIIFISFLIFTQRGMSIFFHKAFKFLAFVGLMSVFINPIFGASA